MIKYILVVLLLLSACKPDNTIPKEIEQDTNIVDDVIIEQSCPECNDFDPCTVDSCSEDTGYVCVYDVLKPCCPNDKCEEGETYSNCDDCPLCESGECQVAHYNYESLECIVEDVVPCCGNDICEKGEDGDSCGNDCPNCISAKTCFTSEYDHNLKRCVDKPIVPCCGNDICDRGESCDSCNKDCECEAGLDLSEFPDFLQDKTLIVVGDEATSQDVLTATTLTTSLAAVGIDTEANLYSLHSSSALASRDLIVLGGPCVNSLWEEYQGTPCNPDYFDVDSAVIKLIVNNNREILYVAGKTADDTEKASRFLTEGSLSGMEIELDTSGSTAKII